MTAMQQTIKVSFGEIVGSDDPQALKYKLCRGENNAPSLARPHANRQSVDKISTIFPNDVIMVNGQCGTLRSVDDDGITLALLAA